MSVRDVVRCASSRRLIARCASSARQLTGCAPCEVFPECDRELRSHDLQVTLDLANCWTTNCRTTCGEFPSTSMNWSRFDYNGTYTLTRQGSDPCNPSWRFRGATVTCTIYNDATCGGTDAVQVIGRPVIIAGWADLPGYGKYWRVRVDFDVTGGDPGGGGLMEDYWEGIDIMEDGEDCFGTRIVLPSEFTPSIRCTNPLFPCYVPPLWDMKGGSVTVTPL